MKPIKYALLYIAISITFQLSAQNEFSYLIPQITNISKTDSGYLVPTTVIDGDTVPILQLYKVVIFPKRKFKSRREWRRYTRLEYNIRVVYPYAKLINYYYYQIENELQYIPENQRKAFLKRKEKELRQQFEKDLINLTITQGRLLIKLVDRETNHTTYDLIVEFKGKMSAIFWQSIARLFGDNLKSKYDPKEEDRMIEEIIAKIENGQ